jgi:predicted O-linked N-acetylglucosamine transferase (SPINDLY family)
LDALRQAIELHRAGHLAEAEQLYRNVLVVSPEHPNALSMLGLLLTGRQPTEAGRALMERACQIAPQLTPPHESLGGWLLQTGQWAAARECFQRALSYHPSHAAFLFGLAEAWQQMHQDEAAAQLLQPLLDTPATRAEAHYRLGLIAQKRGQSHPALEHIERAVQSNPNWVAALENLANLRCERGEWEAALALYRRVVLLDPQRASAFNNLAGPLKALGRLPEAIHACQEAVRLAPSYGKAYLNLGRLYDQQQRPEEACRAYLRAAKVLPPSPQLALTVTHHCQQVCVWNELEAWTDRAREAAAGPGKELMSEEAMEAPFAFLCLPREASADEQLAYARRWSHRYRSRERYPLLSQRRGAAAWSRSRLKIGYLSADFHDHATGWLIAEMLESHDRSAFETIGYSLGGDDRSAIRKRLCRALDSFRDFRELSDDQAARQIAADGIDILVDLKGYTQGARTAILARRPAPLQLNFLGYPGTMGAPFIDAIIADRYVIPEDQQAAYQEEVVYLPGCYQVNDAKAGTSVITTRADHGLPSEALVCCSFNNPYKLTPSIFECWLTLLRRCPRAVLWLIDGPGETRHRLQALAQRAGVERHRLIFAGGLPREQHLARLGLADLFLDSFPVTAHTTASDALRMGVPVLTLCGQTFISRVAASLLHHLRLDELIAHQLAEYQTMAEALLRQPERLASVKAKLHSSLQTTDLFDGRTYARKLEAAYQQLWRRSTEAAQAYDEGCRDFHRRDYAAAARAFGDVLRARPKDVEATLNRGACQERLGDYAAALQTYQQAASLDPYDAKVHQRVAAIQQRLGHEEAAIAGLERAIALDPTFAQAHFELGLVYQSRGEFDSALTSCREGLRWNPRLDVAVVVHLLMQLCLWEEAESLAVQLRSRLQATPVEAAAPAMHPFPLLSLPSITSPAQQLEAAQRWAAERELTSCSPRKLVRSLAKPTNAEANRRLTIGYLSADFREHAVGKLIAEWLPHHDRQAFRIIGYSLHRDDTGPQNRFIQQACDLYRNLQPLTHQQAALQIADDGVDILVDLQGYTREARTEILCCRPAPIQLAYLGYPATMGTDAIDYLLADDYVIPPEQARHYSEEILHLPNGFMPVGAPIPEPMELPSRSSQGLPEGGLVFCAFSGSYKLNRPLFELWLRALQRYPESVLWLRAMNPLAQANLRSFAATRGIPPHRLVFAERTPLPLHLQRHRLADLFLDTFPYNQHSTARDALRAGLPVLTLAGQTFASRVAGSLLRQIGLHDLISESLTDYEARLQRFCDSPDWRQDIAGRLSCYRQASVARDGRAWARALEGIFRQLPTRPIRLGRN